MCRVCISFFFVCFFLFLPILSFRWFSLHVYTLTFGSLPRLFVHTFPSLVLPISFLSYDKGLRVLVRKEVFVRRGGGFDPFSQNSNGESRGWVPGPSMYFRYLLSSDLPSQPVLFIPLLIRYLDKTFRTDETSIREFACPVLTENREHVPICVCCVCVCACVCV